MMNWKNRKSLMIIGAMALVLVIGIASAITANLGSSENAEDELPTAKVRKGPLTISITEAGTITARDQVIIQNKVEGQTTIVSLVPEGEHVEKGDLLIELDSSQLLDNQVEQKIKVQNAEAAFIRARENLAVAKNQAKSDTQKAELDLKLAQMDLKKYLEGEYPNQLKEAESKITLAKEELERATEEAAWSERLYTEKYISQTELESDKLALNRADLDFQLAEASLDLLKEFTYNRTLAELQSDVEQAELALERVQRKAKADVVQAEADLKAKEAEFEQQKNKLAKIDEQLGYTKLYAPVAGMVVYATSAQGGWRGNAEPLDTGQSVRERQELVYLPTANAMMVEVKVHESNLEKVKPDLPVRIKVDAMRGKVFEGRVKKIAPLPDAQSVWLNPDLKVYNTQIEITGPPDGLRTGMTCEAEIVIKQIPSAMYIPIQSVVRVGGKPVVYLQQGGSLVRKEVEVGMDNNRMIQILSGLDENDEVVLAPPITSATIEEEEHSELMQQSSADESKPAGQSTERRQRSEGERSQGQRPEGQRRPQP